MMHEYESWIIKKAEHRRIHAFEVRCWRRLLRGPWTARRSNQSIFREINPEYSLECLVPAWRGQEELPHVRGHGQWPRRPGCDGAGTAERSHPSPRSVRPGGDTPCPSSGAVAKRSYPASKARGGREKPPRTRGQGRWP